MAENQSVKKYEFSLLESQWLKQAVATQRAALTRSRNKEMAASEIYHLRTKEIEMLNVIYSKL